MRAAFAIGALMLLPAVARADEAGASRFDEGVRAFEKGDYAVAVEAFGEAYRASRSGKHLWNLALAEIRAERPFDALLHLREYTARDDASPQNVQRATKLIEREGALVGHLTIAAPSGAEVFVDGSSVGRAPITAGIDVDPKQGHLVEARLGQREAQSQVAPPGSTRVDVTLAFREESPRASSPAPRPSDIRYDAPPNAIPNEGLLSTLVIAETAGGAVAGGVGFSLFAAGGAQNDSSKQMLGGVLMGAAVVLLAADVVTVALWPHAAPARTGSTSTSPSLSVSLGGVSLRGAFE
jgi:hypothetical protein